MRQTKQNILILDIINNSYNHPTAYDIYLICKNEMPNISLGTVYRNLNNLVESSKILRIKMPNNIDRYDKIYNKHAHFICIKCNKVIDIFDKFNIDYKSLNEDVLDYEINFKGICSKCKKEN